MGLPFLFATPNFLCLNAAGSEDPTGYHACMEPEACTAKEFTVILFVY